MPPRWSTATTRRLCPISIRSRRCRGRDAGRIPGPRSEPGPPPQLGPQCSSCTRQARHRIEALSTSGPVRRPHCSSPAARHATVRLVLDAQVALLNVVAVTPCAEAAADQLGTQVPAADGTPPDLPVMGSLPVQDARDGRARNQANHLAPGSLAVGRATLGTVQAAQAHRHAGDDKRIAVAHPGLPRHPCQARHLSATARRRSGPYRGCGADGSIGDAFSVRGTP